MTISFKIQSFPQVSETFVVNSIVHAKSKGYNIRIYTDKFLGLENSSQSDLLKKHEIEKDIVHNINLSKNKLKKFVQVLKMLLNFKVLYYLIPYYKLKRKKNLSPLITLFKYRRINKGILHVHFNNALTPLVELSKIGFINPKCVITFHGYDAFLHDREAFEQIYKEFYRNNVVAVTTNSNYLKQHVISLGVNPSKINVIPIGIDFNQFKGQVKTKTNNSEIRLITVGRLVQLKGQIYAIRAIKVLINLGYNIKYTLIGDGNYQKILEAEVSQLNLTEVVIFEGSKSQDEITSYLKTSHAFLMPSTYDDINARREAFGLVSLEAQASGLPVIGFQSGGFPDTIIEGETGFAVEDRNVNALADKIEKLIQNPTLYENMSKAAIKHASTFDHQFTTQKYLDLYERFTDENECM